MSLYRSVVQKKYLLHLLLKLNILISRIRLKDFEIEIYTSTENIEYLIYLFKNHIMFQFKILSEIVLYDLPGKMYRFVLIYNFLSLEFNCKLKLNIQTSEKLPIFSINALFKSSL